MSDKKLLLDTCALIWLASGSSDLSDLAKEKINKAELVYVSVISAWEISLKVAKKQLELSQKPEVWFTKVLEKHNLKQAALSLDILFKANELPWHHCDPADRFIISTALQENATIVTGDKKFRLYDVKIIG